MRARLQLLFLGGVGPNNVRNVYQCDVDEDFATNVQMVIGTATAPPAPTYGTYGDQMTHQTTVRGKDSVKRMMSDP